MTIIHMQHRIGTVAEWSAGNPILGDGELGFEKETKKFKIGDGATTWLALVYYGAGPTFYDPQSVAAFGAMGTGLTDDSTAFIAARDSGAKRIYVPTGTYSVSGMALSVANQTWILAPGAVIQTRTGGSQTLFEITAAGVNIIGLPGSVIDGNNVGGNAGSTIWVNNATDVTIKGLKFINCLGLGVNGEGDRITIDGNTFVNVGNTAIFVQNPLSTADLIAPKVVRNRVTVASSIANGIYLTNMGGRKVLYAEVSENDVSLPALVDSGIAITLFGGCVSCTVAENTTHGGSMGISIDSGTSVAVSNNSCHGAFLNGIEFAGTGRSTMTGNTVNGNALTATGYSIVNTGATTSGKNSLVGNSATNLVPSTGVGMLLQDSAGAYSLVIGNFLTAHKPLLINGQKGYTIVGNLFMSDGTAASGTELNGVTDSVVAQNTYSGFSDAAVNVYSGTMAGLLIGPNILTDGTPTDLVNAWTPGTNGVGSRLTRGNHAPVAPSLLSPGASPWTYTNLSLGVVNLYISGGTVTSIKRGTTVVSNTTPCSVLLNPGETAVITYSVEPAVALDPR